MITKKDTQVILYKKLLFSLSIILFILFIGFSYIVAKETFIQIDFDTTIKFQDNIPHYFDLPFSFLSILGSAEITILIWFAIFVLALKKRFWLTVIFLPLFFVSVIIEILGKLFIYHPGPPHLFYKGVIDFSLPSHYVITNYSYPSGHVTRTSFLIIFFIILLLLKVRLPARLLLQIGLLVLWISILVSRIYLGEHWTSDVIGGFLLGTSLGMFTAATIPTEKESNE